MHAVETIHDNCLLFIASGKFAVSRASFRLKKHIIAVSWASLRFKKIFLDVVSS